MIKYVIVLLAFQIFSADQVYQTNVKNNFLPIALHAKDVKFLGNKKVKHVVNKEETSFEVCEIDIAGVQASVYDTCEELGKKIKNIRDR